MKPKSQKSGIREGLAENPVPRQRLSQQVSTATNMKVTKKELLETMFSMLSVPWLTPLQ
jgi:hypothetical protein